MAPETALITYSDILAASRRLRAVARHTPLIENDDLNAACGGRIFLKPECLQRTGSFKIRGAYNRLARIAPDQRRFGVVAFSSGNHAQGVAAAARRLGIPALIVMPEDAPRIKRENTAALGAEIRLYDRFREDREAIAADIAAARGALLVPSYDDPDIIAGQGTVGLEIARDLKRRRILPDAVLVPVGGGGLIAGTATAMKQVFPSIAVHGVEPQGFDDTARSLRLGERVENSPKARSICDALLAPMPGGLTFAHNRRLLDPGLVVSDDEVRTAMRFAFERLKLVLEPGGAVALAALLAGRLPAAGRTIVLVLSGGNIDRESFCG
ncbi:MAG: threonine/serine dehydratase [Rhodothalassiaceae bacterium]